MFIGFMDILASFVRLELFKLGFIAVIMWLVFVISTLTKTQFKDYFDPRRWKSVAIFLLKWALHKLGDKPGKWEPFEVEQNMIRILSCPKCLVNTKCLGCGCDALARMNVREDYCDLGRWGDFKTKEDWEDYKAEYKIKFKVYFNDVDIDDIKTPEYNE